eukprot:2620265-Lingulodinium_polyedra.AAC.1
MANKPLGFYTILGPCSIELLLGPASYWGGGCSRNVAPEPKGLRSSGPPRARVRAARASARRAVQR